MPCSPRLVVDREAHHPVALLFGPGRNCPPSKLLSQRHNSCTARLGACRGRRRTSTDRRSRPRCVSATRRCPRTSRAPAGVGGVDSARRRGRRRTVHWHERILAPCAALRGPLFVLPFSLLTSLVTIVVGSDRCMARDGSGLDRCMASPLRSLGPCSLSPSGVL